MSEFHEGRVAATFSAGHKVEDTKDIYEKEIVVIDGMKSALLAAIKNLEAYGLQLQKEALDAKLSIKEADTAVKYVGTCVEILKKMTLDAETKRLAAFGAVEALKRVVADLKNVWDQEQKKLKEILDFEAQQPKDFKNRPTGYMPKEHPLDEHRRDTEQVDVTPDAISTHSGMKKARKSKAQA